MFQLVDSETNDISKKKTDFLKIYHRQAANLKDSDQNILYILGENNIYYQIGNYYLQKGNDNRQKNCCCS